MVFPVRENWHAPQHIAPLSGAEKVDLFFNIAGTGTGGRADLCFSLAASEFEYTPARCKSTTGLNLLPSQVDIPEYTILNFMPVWGPFSSAPILRTNLVLLRPIQLHVGEDRPLK